MEFLLGVSVGIMLSFVLLMAAAWVANHRPNDDDIRAAMRRHPSMWDAGPHFRVSDIDLPLGPIRDDSEVPEG